MPTTAQPSAGTALPSTSLTSGLIFARNEAETVATVTAVTGITTDGTSLTYATDADGRAYTRTGAGGEFMGAVNTYNVPAEKTILVVAKYVGNGANQMFFGCDNNPPRRLWFYVNSSGGIGTLMFTSGDVLLSGGGGSPANMNGALQAVLLRVRNDAGTWKSRIDVGTTAGTEAAITGGAPGAITGSLTRGWRGGGGSEQTATKTYFSAIWNRALSDTEMAGLRANPWSIYDTPSSVLDGGLTLDALMPGGEIAVSASLLSGGITLDDYLPGGALDVPPGTVVIPELRNWGGSLQAGVTVPVVTLCRLTDGAQVLTLTSRVTDGSGNISVTSASLIPGTWYMAVGWNADGSSRFARPVQAA